jgi:hypothetical protein
LLRTRDICSEELEYFERCKEERLARDGRRKEAFSHFIESNCSLILDSAGQKPLLVGFLGYIFGAQLKYLIESVIRSRSANEGKLLPLAATDHITGEDVQQIAPQILEKIKGKQLQIERKKDKVKDLTYPDRQAGLFGVQEGIRGVFGHTIG